MLQGEKTDLKVAHAFSESLRTTGHATAILTNQKKDGTHFRHRLTGTRARRLNTTTVVARCKRLVPLTRIAGERMGPSCLVAESQVLPDAPSSTDAFGDAHPHRPSRSDNVMAIVCVAIVCTALLAALLSTLSEPAEAPPLPPPSGLPAKVGKLFKAALPTGAFVGLATLANADLFLLIPALL
jgi:hypothetical protein|mmetsp:Transcript_39221/g.89093  ORF Transcript_39221/g.89093 Transcript_39221/m.89093 type:complete len:183 (-) Transcript_39221:493-1041(-)